MTDERIKELMAQVGMPDSQSLMIALKQVANEVEQEVLARFDEPSLEDDEQKMRNALIRINEQLEY